MYISFFKISILTDQNASSNYVRFYPALKKNLQYLDFDLIFAESCWSEDEATMWRRKAAKCAEVLIPNVIPDGYIQGAYVANEIAENALRQVGFTLPIRHNPYLFFCERG